MTTTDIALLALRVFMGKFFIVAAYLKTREPELGHRPWPALREALGLPGWMQWFIPTAQMLGGIALVIGFLTPLAALGLFIILFAALILDGWKPLCHMLTGASPARWVYGFCENYHVLMLLLLAVITLSGAGGLSLDALIF